MTTPHTPRQTRDELVHGDPDCSYRFLEAKVAPSIDPSLSVDVACFMTTDTVDADNEVVLPSGADLTRFDKNPVLMLCHAHGQPGSYYPLPVGKIVWTKKRPNGIMAGLSFARSSAMGKEIKGLFDEDMLRSFSIGFRSLESSPMTRDEAYSRPDWKAAYERTGGRVLVHRKWSLIELSIAPIPSNEDALRANYAARGMPIPDWLHVTTARPAEPLTPENLVSKEANMNRPIQKGDSVAWTRKGGGRGVVQSVHTQGTHPHDEQDDDSETLDATHDDPVAKVKCHIKGDDGYMETDTIKALHCKHLTKLDDELPSSDPSADKSVKCHPQDDDEPDDKDFDDNDEDQDESKADDESIRTHDFVRIRAPHHEGVGQVKSLHVRGIVPHVDENIRGTPADPAARIKCFKPMGDGHLPTDQHIGAKCKHLERIDDLNPPTRQKPEKSMTDARALPPLALKADHEILEESLVRLNALLRPETVQQMVRLEIERITGTV